MILAMKEMEFESSTELAFVVAEDLLQFGDSKKVMWWAFGLPSLKVSGAQMQLMELLRREFEETKHGE